MELKIKVAVADSGAQIAIVPASLLDQSGIEITGNLPVEGGHKGRQQCEDRCSRRRRRHNQRVVALWQAFQDVQQDLHRPER